MDLEAFSDWDEEDVYGRDDDFLYGLEPEEDGDGEPVDLTEFEAMAQRKIIFHKTCKLGHSADLAALLMSEAELFLNNCDYKSALVAALAANLAAADIDAFYHARKAIETIALYQLGDRKAAVATSKLVKAEKIDSVYLRQRFENTVEVLEFMPQLLGMLSGMSNRDHS